MTFRSIRKQSLLYSTALKHGSNIAIVTDIPTNKKKAKKLSDDIERTVDDSHDARFLQTVKKNSFGIQVKVRKTQQARDA